MARGVFQRLALAALIATSCRSFGCQGSADAGTFDARSQGKASPASADVDCFVLLQVHEELRPAADSASWPLASAPTGEELRLFKPNHLAASKRARVASGKQALAAAHILAGAPNISLFPWRDLVTLARVKPGKASQEEAAGAKDVTFEEGMDVDETRRMNEMMGLLQEFVDYVTDDGFMRSFGILSASYQDRSVAFRSKASTLLHSFMNSTRDSSDRTLMRKVSRYMDSTVALIHQFVKQTQGSKMGIFVESMPTGVLQANEILPRLSSIAALVDSPGGARRGGTALRRLGPDTSSTATFCKQIEPLFENSSRAVHEFSELIGTVNASQESIPMIGRFMDAILPDSPEAAEVAPRVMQLEEQVLDTVYSIVFALREVTRGYDWQVGGLLRERLRCNTTSGSFESAGSRQPLGSASLLAPLVALLLWP